MNNVVRPAFHVDREPLGHIKQTAPAELSFNSEACHLAMNLFGVILLARWPVFQVREIRAGNRLGWF